MDALPEQSRFAETIGRPSLRRRAVVTHLMDGDGVPDAGELARLILKVAQQQDRQAFARLYSHFAPRVTAFIRKSGLPANTAEEIAQEAMLAVWRKAAYYDPARAGAATWIFTIARNLRIDHLRRARVAVTAEKGLPEEDEAAPSGETLLLATERDAGLRTALNALSEEQALVLRLSFFSEKAHSEIARELGLPLGTVKSRVRLALGRLRALLEGQS